MRDHLLGPTCIEGYTQLLVLLTRENVGSVVFQSAISLTKLLDSTEDGFALKTLAHAVQLFQDLLSDVMCNALHHRSK